MAAESNRPVPPALPTVDQVPEELRLLKRWVGWRAVWDPSKEKWRKPPHSPVTGEGIGAVEKYTDHWLTFEEACSGVARFKLDGVGFVFKTGDGYIGIDFDDCRKDGKVHPEIESWLKWFPTYQEVSPSGTGIHCIGKGKVNKALVPTEVPKAEGSHVEIYGWDRYFTYTGQFTGPLKIGDCQIGIEKLFISLGLNNAKGGTTAEDPNKPRPLTKWTALKLHKDNLEALRNAKQGEGNALINTTAFFAGRGFAAKIFDERTEEDVKNEILNVVTKEWKSPHPEHGARMTIDSGWRSGLDTPLVIVEDEWPQVRETLDDFNKRFFLVRDFGSKARVCWEEPARMFAGKGLELRAQATQDFRTSYDNELIVVGENEDGTPKLEGKASIWLRHKYRRTYDKVVFEPEVQTPKNIYNLWRGFAFEPKKGDCSLYLGHLKENVCLGDTAKYNYLIGWMAYAVRHPNEQGHVAIVIQGLKGVGKNVAAEGFANLWGQHALVVSDQARITRNFNAHLRDKCVLIADEAFFAGDRRHEGNLKELITGHHIVIEQKGVDAVKVANLLHIIIIGNDDWLVPASYEERRFLALTCGSGHRQDGKYFQAINTQLQNGGYAGLLWHLLEEVRLEKFNVREAPHTDELRGQMMESLRGVEKVWYNCLFYGTIPGQPQRDGTVLMKTIELVDWANARSESRWDDIKPHHVSGLLGASGKDRKRGMGFEFKRSMMKGERQYLWIIPALPEARRTWNDARFSLKWLDDDGEWDTIQDTEVKF